MTFLFNIPGYGIGLSVPHTSLCLIQEHFPYGLEPRLSPQDYINNNANDYRLYLQKTITLSICFICIVLCDGKSHVIKILSP